MDLENYFKTNQDKFDIQSPESGHTLRFEQQLKKQRSNKRYYLKTIFSIAAAILILITLSFRMFSTNEPEIPQELAESQQYFNSIINKQLKQLQKHENATSKIIIDDTLKELKILENEYRQLLIELKNSENQQLIIDLLIQNFQQRIKLLKQVTKDVQSLKNTNYETT